MYCTALPSSKPVWPPGSSCDGLEGLTGREAPVGAAGLDVPGGRVEQVLPVGGAPHHGGGLRGVVLGRGDLGDGEVVDGVLEGDRAADGVVDGGQVERAGVDVVLAQVLAQVLAFDLEAVPVLGLRGALDHVRSAAPMSKLRTPMA